MILLALMLLSTDVAVTVDDLPSTGRKSRASQNRYRGEDRCGSFAQHRLPPVYGFVNGARPDPGVLPMTGAPRAIRSAITRSVTSTSTA